jgi:hypothetical protein
MPVQPGTGHEKLSPHPAGQSPRSPFRFYGLTRALFDWTWRLSGSGIMVEGQCRPLIAERGDTLVIATTKGLSELRRGGAFRLDPGDV